jgi:hypothetical protein
MALSPLAAMRATDAITLHLLSDLHPLAVALAVSDSETAAAFARRWLVNSGTAEEYGVVARRRRSLKRPGRLTICSTSVA